MARHSKCLDHAAIGASGSTWWMLLSHHAPCDLDRTWPMFGVRVCVRCLAMALAFPCGIAIVWAFAIQSTLPHSLFAWALMLPAGIDFMAGELCNGYPRTNAFRFLSGLAFGLGVGMTLGWWVFAGTATPFAAFVILAVLMEFAIAFVFHFTGHLEGYIAKYEAACRGS